LAADAGEAVPKANTAMQPAKYRETHMAVTSGSPAFETGRRQPARYVRPLQVL